MKLLSIFNRCRIVQRQHFCLEMAEGAVTVTLLSLSIPLKTQKSQDLLSGLRPCSCRGIYSAATLGKSEFSQTLHNSLSILALQGKACLWMRSTLSTEVNETNLWTESGFLCNCCRLGTTLNFKELSVFQGGHLGF